MTKIVGYFPPRRCGEEKDETMQKNISMHSFSLRFLSASKSDKTDLLFKYIMGLLENKTKPHELHKLHKPHKPHKLHKPHKPHKPTRRMGTKKRGFNPDWVICDDFLCPAPDDSVK